MLGKIAYLLMAILGMMGISTAAGVLRDNGDANTIVWIAVLVISVVMFAFVIDGDSGSD